ncbi:uncharacterized protein METZ01_LOCUS376629 [marine metagenome]|uniref:Uncharacterized protein n=1 Tax=marine metagenome TaxID=408172 RepID=A0A382TPT3_9ZZZZ
MDSAQLVLFAVPATTWLLSALHILWDRFAFTGI